MLLWLKTYLSLCLTGLIEELIASRVNDLSKPKDLLNFTIISYRESELLIIKCLCVTLK